MKLDTIMVSKQSQFGEQDCTYRIHPKKNVADNPVSLHFLLKSEFKRTLDSLADSFTFSFQFQNRLLKNFGTEAAAQQKNTCLACVRSWFHPMIKQTNKQTSVSVSFFRAFQTFIWEQCQILELERHSRSLFSTSNQLSPLHVACPHNCSGLLSRKLI